jgi:hypothetical protein
MLEELKEIAFISSYILTGILIALICFSIPVAPMIQIIIGATLCIIFGFTTIK